MPNVKGNKGSRQGGYHTSAQIKKTQKPAYARDDLDKKFAGEENVGPEGNPKLDDSKDSHIKNRKTTNEHGKDEKDF